MNLQAGYLLYYDCAHYPQRIISVYMVYIISLLILFANFFIVSYLGSGGKKKDRRDKKPTHKEE
jgi:hypothetical protein